jgi:hypothetical protein
MNERFQSSENHPDSSPATGDHGPALFHPHPNLADAVNRNIVHSEIEGGVWLARVPVGALLEVQTVNRIYTVVYLGEGEAMISGHPDICPEPTRVYIAGSNWGGSMLKVQFIGRGMHMEFTDPQRRRIITSPVVDVRERRAA